MSDDEAMKFVESLSALVEFESIQGQEGGFFFGLSNKFGAQAASQIFHTDKEVLDLSSFFPHETEKLTCRLLQGNPDGFRVESPKKFQVSLDNLRSDIFLYPDSMAKRRTPEAEQLEF